MAIPKDKVEYIFTALDSANVSTTDFSMLTGISRNALQRWKAGENIADMLRLNLAYTYATRLEVACRCGKLPLTDKLEKKQRIVVIRKIVHSMSSK